MKCNTRLKRAFHDENILLRGGKNIRLLYLKSDSHLPKNYVIYFIESPLKMMKNAFYYIKISFLMHKMVRWKESNSS